MSERETVVSDERYRVNVEKDIESVKDPNGSCHDCPPFKTNVCVGV